MYVYQHYCILSVCVWVWVYCVYCVIHTAYDDYEKGCYSPKLLRMVDVEEVSGPHNGLCVHVYMLVWRR